MAKFYNFQKNFPRKKNFGVAEIPRNRKIGVKFWKMIFKENTFRVILRPFGGKSDVKWGCDTTYKSEYAKPDIRLVLPLKSTFIFKKSEFQFRPSILMKKGATFENLWIYRVEKFSK